MTSHPIPIALQLYTLRAELAADWRGVLQKIAKVGFAGVETAGFEYAPLAQVKAQLDDLGLPVIAAHQPLPLGADQNRVLDTVAALGCRRVICAGTGRDQFDTPEKVRARAELFNEANAVAQSQGYEFGLHTHWWEFQKIGEQRADELLFADLDQTVFLELDTYWAVAGGVDPLEVLASLAPRVPLLHIKDGPVELGVPQVTVGRGKMDFSPIIQAAPQTEWLVVELDECDTDMLTAVSESYRYLTGEGLGQGRS